jgi:hypothetical protein
MQGIRRGLLIAVLGTSISAASMAAGQGYYRSYGSYSYYPRYQNNYHGYWRDQGYGFTNRPVYGGYHYSEGYWGGPAYPAYNPYHYYGGRSYRW